MLILTLVLAPSVYAGQIQPTSAAGSLNLWITSTFAFILLLFLSGLYVAAETAVDVLRSTHVRHVREAIGERSARLQELIDKRMPYVTACLLASRLARLGLFLLVLVVAPSVAGAIEGIPPSSLAYASILPWTICLGVPVTLFSLILGELVPRSYATLHPHRVGMVLYNPIRVASFLLSVPAAIIVALANVLTNRFGGKAAFGGVGVAEEEIKNLVESAEETGEIESDERELIHSVLEFNDRVAKEIMTPRVDLDALPLKTEPGELLSVIQTTGHSRIPLYEDTDDQIVGIVHAKDLLLAMAAAKPFTLRELMRPPLFVPENKSLHELLRELRASRSQMAVIQDEFGGTAGIVTTEDIVEELVGDIVDEYDEEETTLTHTDEGWFVSGRLHVDEVNEALGTEFESDEFDTIGGLVFGQFGRQPRTGERVQIDGFEFGVEETDGRRISRLRIRPCSSEEEPGKLEAS
ncbi:MAG TPA: hemolysin family protein [Fimbriimonadaceae bacterium]|nr:hemolysin family protein [Fimbriimonadaceae bacterium]